MSSPDEIASVSTHDLNTSEGCFSEAERIYWLAKQNNQPEDQCLMAFLDWSVEGWIIQNKKSEVD